MILEVVVFHWSNHALDLLLFGPFARQNLAFTVSTTHGEKINQERQRGNWLKLPYNKKAGILIRPL